MSDTIEPSTEFRPFRIVFPPLNRLGDRRQDLLSDIIRIRFLHPLLPSQAQDDRPIDFDELMPRRLIRRIADADQQARSCFRGRGHQCAPFLSFIHGRGPSLTPASVSLGERQLRIYPNTSTKRQRVSPETHLLALRAGMNATAARLIESCSPSWVAAMSLRHRRLHFRRFVQKIVGARVAVAVGSLLGTVVGELQPGRRGLQFPVRRVASGLVASHNSSKNRSDKLSCTEGPSRCAK